MDAAPSLEAQLKAAFARRDPAGAAACLRRGARADSLMLVHCVEMNWPGLIGPLLRAGAGHASWKLPGSLGAHTSVFAMALTRRRPECAAALVPPEEELQAAVVADDAPRVRALLAAGADPNFAGVTAPPVMAAACCRRAACLKLLLRAGASLDLGAREFYGPAAMAAVTGSYACLRELMKHEAATRGVIPLLHAALRGGDAQCAKLLLSSGASPTEEHPLFGNPMHSAARSGEMVRLLLDSGGRPHALSLATGKYPIHDAASTGDALAVASLASAGADVDALSGAGRTPLFTAVMCGNRPALQGLLAAGATVTPDVMMAACAKGDDRSLEDLMHNGSVQPTQTMLRQVGCFAPLQLPRGV